jgi:hypothetical protein
MSGKPTILATLVRGQTFIYAGKTFLKGKPVEVTAAERDYLTENAVDVVTTRYDEAGEPENSVLQKFKFSAERGGKPLAVPAQEQIQENPL